MELLGAPYLYTLATVSITFVGFAALLLAFRQTMGSGLTKYDSYFTLTFIQTGFIVTAGSMLPQILGYFQFSTENVWRAASALIAVPMTLFIASLPGRRRAVAEGPIPNYIRILLSLQGLMVVTLLSYAIGFLSAPGVAVYSSILSSFLFTTGIAYTLALKMVLHK